MMPAKMMIAKITTSTGITIAITLGPLGAETDVSRLEYIINMLYCAHKNL